MPVLHCTDNSMTVKKVLSFSIRRGIKGGTYQLLYESNCEKINKQIKKANHLFAVIHSFFF